MQLRNVLSQLSRGTLVFLALQACANAGENATQVAMLVQESPATSKPESLAVRELVTPGPMADTVDLTAATDDLWLRMRNGFSMPNLNNDLVLQQQQWYLNHPEYLRRVVERSQRYLYHIVEELEKRGMPTELALLPMVESSFNPMAYSKAHASGLWQFIPSTGKRFDLQQNWWHDQRRDIVASTSAALDYLQTIYEMHGDWHLALASYNWGEGAVKRAIQKNIAKGLPTDYSSLTMPNETRQYVPKLMALKNIFANPVTVAQLNLPAVVNRPYFATFEPNRPIDVKIAARLAGMSVDEFVALNPANNRPVIKPASTLVIPADKMEAFQTNLENHDAPLSTWQVYTLKPGERLDKLAPRFGITLADLKRVNGLNGKLRISAGSSLLVPARDGAEINSLPDEIRVPETIPERAKGKRIAKKGKGGKLAAKGRGGANAKKHAVAKKAGAAKISRKAGGKRA